MHRPNLRRLRLHLLPPVLTAMLLAAGLLLIAARSTATPEKRADSPSIAPAAAAFPASAPRSEPPGPVPAAPLRLDAGEELNSAIARARTSARPPAATDSIGELPQSDGVMRQVKIPILMFHYVGVLPAGADAIRRDLTVSPERFEEHLRHLQAAGFHSISLRDVYAHLVIGKLLPERPIVLTFDDGHHDNYEVAFPLLRRYGFKAAFFVITEFVDQGRPEYMTWDHLAEMHAAGMEIEAHGRSHVDLRGRDLDFLVWQILGPAESIAAHVGEPPRFYAYPLGKSDEQVTAVLRSAHYWGGLTIRQGALHATDRLLEMPRIRVRGRYEPGDLAREIDYWVAKAPPANGQN